MKIYLLFAAIFILPISQIACTSGNRPNRMTQMSMNDTIVQADTIKPAALQPELYLPLLQGKRVGLIANQTALVHEEHLLDFLLRNKIEVVKIFSPEHGFRGNIERGEVFNAEIDEKTGLPVIPMYGNSRKPKSEMLENVDVLVFDIQDVGVRFYTYISSMHLAMEAAAENKLEFMVLDRPNPLGDYTDGPILDLKYQSFVGMHPIPVVHGLTVGELAGMINGEGWLGAGAVCNLTVIPVKNYAHDKKWSLKVKPSPNLPNDISIRLYPSLCFFEATKVSIGRGTDFPFQVVGYPDSSLGSFSFVPNDIAGVQTNPVQKGKTCYGFDLRDESPQHRFSLAYFLKFNKALKERGITMISRPAWFNLLAGNNLLLTQVEKGMSEEEIRESWQDDLAAYEKMRRKYLLYPELSERK